MYLKKIEAKDLPFVRLWLEEYTMSEYCPSLSGQSNIVEADLLDPSNLYLAIVTDDKEIMGMVNLKNIQNESAELTITVRTEAMHRGYAWFGMEEILRQAFFEKHLESVYWCVPRTNTRAIRFFDKHNFHEVIDIPSAIVERYKEIDNLKWYSVLKGDEFNVRDTVAGCRVIRIKTIPTVNAGELSFFEGTREVPFDIKRVYYISKVPEGVRRGFHAHKELKQLLFCPYGRIQIVLENRNGREEIELSDPSIAVLIEECTWREMVWLQKDSVLCVAASDFYDVNDYIRDYLEFRNYIQL